MAKYSIYRINSGKIEDVKIKLQSVDFQKIDERVKGPYVVTTYFTAKPKPTDIWWLEQFKDLFEKYSKSANLAYSGAIIAENTDSKESFLIALGKTHFYVQDNIDLSFGLRMAERIGSSVGVKTQASKTFGGLTSKAITSYTSDSVLSFSPGQATDYVKIKAKDSSLWGGSYIHFGTSIQFTNIDQEPEAINILLTAIENAQKESSAFSLPRMIRVKDKGLIEELDKELATAIKNGEDVSAGVVDFELYGTDFVFSQQTHVCLEYRGLMSVNIDELSLADIWKFAEDNELDLQQTLRGIKAKIFVNDSSKMTTPLIKLIDYVADDYFLYRGNWHIFSDSFISTLTSQIESISVDSLGISFSKTEHQKWQKDNPDRSPNYREVYVIDKILQLNPHQVSYDRTQDYKSVNGKKTNIEVSDIYDPSAEEINVVKIGTARAFGYAFDQAIRTLSLTNKNKYKTEKGDNIPVKALRLTLVSTNVQTPQSAQEINSLSFKIKLSELKRLADDKKVSLTVTFAKYDGTEGER